MKNLYWEGFFKIISVQYNIYSTIQYISTNYSIYYSCAVRKSVSEQTLGGPIFVQFDEKKLNNWCTVFSEKMQLECFFLSGFSFTDTDDSQDRKGREGTIFLFHSTISTRSRTFIRFFATLHVRCLSHIFNRNACIYQTATRWDLPPYRITIWLIDDEVSFCLFTWWFDTRFLLQQSWYRKLVDS